MTAETRTSSKPRTEAEGRIAVSTVSLVVPTYNRGAKLAGTVTSILSCDIEGLGVVEVIVVDDGSTSPVAPLIDSIGSAEGFAVKCIRQDNAGPAAARNRGFRAAGGELVIFVDDDILVPSDFIQSHRRAHAERPRSVIYGRCRFVEPASVTPAFRYVQSLEALWAGDGDGEVVVTEAVASGQLSVERRDFADAKAVYDSSLTSPAAEEFELAHRLGRLGIQIVRAGAIIAEHDSPVDIEGICRQQYKYGVGCAEVGLKRPQVLALDGLARHLSFSGLAGRNPSTGDPLRRTLKSILSSRLCRLLLVTGTKLLERLVPRSPLLPWVYRKLIALHFVAGVREGERIFSADEQDAL